MIEEMLTMRPAPSAIIWGTTYLVRTIGDKSELRMVASPLSADPGVVDKSVDRTEGVAQLEGGNLVDPTEQARCHGCRR